MKNTLFLAAALAAISAVSNGQVTTDPVGFVSVTVKSGSDATIAVPMNRASEFKGVIASAAGSVITVTGNTGWTDGQFVYNGTTKIKTYAVQIASGASEGMIAKITANTTVSGVSTLTVQLDAGDTLTGLAGASFDVLAYWTPASLFSVAPPLGFELSGFENSDVGVNFGASEIYAHAGTNAWEDGINGGDASNSPLRFGAALIARNSSGSDFTATMVGAVPMTAHRIRLSTRAGNVAQDQYVGYIAPVAESLATVTNPNALGFPVAEGDSIQGFDNNELGINKGASVLYVWNGAAWEDGINGGEITPAEQLKPGFGYIFQKAPTLTPTSVVWTHIPAYLQ